MSSSQPFIFDPEVLNSALEEEHATLAVLYQEHLRLFDEGRMVFYLPQSMGERFMDDGILEGIAKKMRSVIRNHREIPS